MASLEGNTTAWQTYRDLSRAARAAAYTGVYGSSPVTFSGSNHASLSTLVLNQASGGSAEELKIDELFANTNARLDNYYSVSTGGISTDAPFGFPKTKDIEATIEANELSGGGTNIPGNAAAYMAQQRQMDILESFRKAYRQRIQKKQQLLTHKQFLETWVTQVDADFYNLLLNVRINDNVT